MSEALRAFVAVQVAPTPALRSILDEFAAMGRAVRPAAADKLHLTVKFLGATDPQWIAETAKRLDDVASRTRAFEVALRGLGTFPSVKRPSVIWTGIVPSEPVVRLATAVEAALVDLGFSPETRGFRAHVTLARIKSRPPHRLRELLEQHAATEFATFTVGELVLMQSQLTPPGSQYTPLAVAELRA